MYRRFLFIIVCIFMLATVVSAQETAPESLTSTPRPSEAMLFAQHSDRDKELAAEIYQNFLKADPKIFLLTEEGQKNIQWVEWEIPATDEEYAFVKSKAEEITSGLETDAEKIRAVAEYTALNVCYDYDYYEHGTKVYSELALTPYKILTEKNTVCEGYSRLCEALLQAVDIPCVYVLSPEHSWNMAWDGERWILFDSTWMSNCILEYGKYKYSTKLNTEWFDFTFEEALDEYNHLILELPYNVAGGVLTKYPLWSSAEAIHVYEGAEEIEGRLFLYMRKNTVYLPKSLKRLNLDTFYYDIEKVYIDDMEAWLGIDFGGYSSANPMHGGAELFVKGERLTELVVPDTVTSLDCALFGCESLERITLHSGITKIAAYTFYGCTNLRSINIPESITYIGRSAFAYCESLSEVHINNIEAWLEIEFGDYTSSNPISVGAELFVNGEKLTGLIVPDTVTDLGYSLVGCNSLESVILHDGMTKIGDYAFYGCTNLRSINIHEGITRIGSSAFGYCESLTEIHIPKAVQSIGQNAFLGCEGLVSINIPDGIRSIEAQTFCGCKILSKIEIPESVVAIGSGAFRGCLNLSEISIPESVTEISEAMFLGCKSLKAISLPGNTTKIGEGAFGGCRSLSNIEIPDNVTVIEGSAFENCNLLKSIILPKKLTSIGSRAFYGCISLAEISVPDTVTNIGTEAFRECEALAEISLPSGITTVPESIFNGCTSLSKATLHNGITIIGSYAFYGCSALTDIIFPSTLETIDSYAFYNCTSLTEITVPEGLISIGSSALSRAAIKTVNYASDEEAWRAIDNSSSLKNIQLNCNVIAVNSATAKAKEINVNGTFTSAITGLSEGITAEELEGLLVCSSNWEIGVYDNGGEKTASDAVIATGFRICFTSADGNVQREFLLSVYGDVNGDGMVNALDVTNTLSHIAGGKRAAYGFAVDKSSDGVITMDELNSFISVFR